MTVVPATSSSPCGRSRSAGSLLTTFWES